MMKKARSVDFGRLSFRSTCASSSNNNTHTASQTVAAGAMASQFSLRAASALPSQMGRLYASHSNKDVPSLSVCRRVDSHERNSEGHIWPDSLDETDGIHLIPNSASIIPSNIPSESLATGRIFPWSLRKISVVVFVVATAIDWALCHVPASISSSSSLGVSRSWLDNLIHYDALSPEVIRPAFRYATSSTTITSSSSSSLSSMRPHRTSLGSAALVSITEALAPILPFAGGLDLRKSDYWTWTPSNSPSGDNHDRNSLNSESGNSSNGDNIWQTLVRLVITLQEAFRNDDDNPTPNVITPVGSLSHNQARKQNRNPSTVATPAIHPVMILSRSEPFVSRDTIAEMTLSEVTETFRYALQCNQEGFQEASFFAGVSDVTPRVRFVITRMKNAMAQSRGGGPLIPLPISATSKTAAATTATIVGQVDALAFAAAMRVLAEWRILRQVPEGYKGFAVGMSLGHKDVLQNVAKIESTVHQILMYMNTDHQRDQEGEKTLTCVPNGSTTSDGRDECSQREEDQTRLLSPTLRDVLQFEIDMDINPANRLPRLKDKSASMGILWVRRQLHYQTLLFDNVLQVPNRFMTTVEAVMAAYASVYDQFHGWAVQKIFNYSFQSAPEAEEIYKHMNPVKFHNLIATAAASKAVASSSSIAPRLPTDLPSPPPNDHPLVSFCRHIGSEWDKVVSNVLQFWDVANKNPPLSLLFRGGGEGGASSLSSSMKVPSKELLLQYQNEDSVVKGIIQDAHEHIHYFLKVVYPLLNDLAGLFDEMNMDDPTRV